ncbi:permease prefix domain 1-containing protein [Deinococcus multiflagellatus]|uniref:Permease prefix domain 1-containing protein n=1 Tax=Deinococcus multiflagellatus TaxID=1656887 RepID=A0ABW1ZJL6_9DEIO|nr:permease prefix domain 1-containing protein [Deinococcus multiflagellatus]MBZ9713219.1 permease prefix domain 1-containing protein [Deinococcus multiflagellatus]
MTPEERFVRAATRGLRGQARRDAQAELRSHIHERAAQLQLILGATAEADARAQAMRELGAPAHIARGLRRTHWRWSAGMGVLAASVLLTSWVANAYSRGQEDVTRLVNRVLFPSAQWVDPCQGRSACLAIYSDGPLTAQEIKSYGIMPFSEARGFLKGLGVQTHGLFQKTLVMPGEAALSAKPFTVEVGRLGHAGVKRGYLNVAEALAEGARQGWPLQVDGVTLGVRVAGRPIAPDTQLGLRTIEAYLENELDQKLTPAVRAAAQVQESLGEPAFKSKAWAFEARALAAATLGSILYNRVNLAVSRPGQLYALVTFSPRRVFPNQVLLPALNAWVVSSQGGRLSFPVVAQGEERPQLNFVASQSQFLDELRAGREAAMLLAVPNDLTPMGQLHVVPLPPGPVTAGCSACPEARTVQVP